MNPAVYFPLWIFLFFLEMHCIQKARCGMREASQPVDLQGRKKKVCAFRKPSPPPKLPSPSLTDISLSRGQKTRKFFYRQRLKKGFFDRVENEFSQVIIYSRKRVLIDCTVTENEETGPEMKTRKVEEVFFFLPPLKLFSTGPAMQLPNQTNKHKTITGLIYILFTLIKLPFTCFKTPLSA